MGDCSKGSINYRETNNNLSPAIFTIDHTGKPRGTLTETTTDTVKFSSQSDIKQITTEEARKELNAILRRNIFGFFLGVLASLFIAIGTSCTQVTSLFS